MLRNVEIASLCFVALFLGFTAVAQADPTISSVSSPVGIGGSVSISGAGFGTHTMGIEWLGDFIEEQQLGAALTKAKWEADSDFGGFTSPRISSDRAHSGNKAILSRIDDSVENKWGSGYTFNVGHAIDSIYVSWWVRFQKGSESGQWKKWRLSATASYGDTHPEMMQSDWYNSDGTHSQEYVINAVASGTYWYPGSDSIWMSSDEAVPAETWVRLEYYFKENSGAGQVDGSFQYFIHKQDELVRTIRNYVGNFKTRSSDLTRQYVQFQNYWGNHSSGELSDATIFIDDIYIQMGTRARVEIGDNQVWENCRHREIQVPTSWSSSSITITPNKGSFQDGATAYLFVVDGNGNASNGYPITIGGEMAPGAPTGVRIVE